MLDSPRPALALLFVSLVAGCGVRGSGVTASETRELDSFTRVETGGAFDLIIHVGAETQKVVVSGDDNIVPKVETKVRGDELVVEYEGMLRPELSLTIEIWLESLEGVEASGATDLDIEGLAGDAFVLELSGAADANLRGRVGRFELEISGAADVEANGLEAETVVVDLSGAGNAKVWATKSLDVDISGAGEVDYWGSPAEVSQDVGGSGSLRRH